MRFRVGDTVICTGKERGRQNTPDYGGAGWKKDRIFTIKNISGGGIRPNDILWPDDDKGRGIFIRRVTLYAYVPEELFEL